MSRMSPHRNLWVLLAILGVACGGESEPPAGSGGTASGGSAAGSPAAGAPAAGAPAAGSAAGGSQSGASPGGATSASGAGNGGSNGGAAAGSGGASGGSTNGGSTSGGMATGGASGGSSGGAAAGTGGSGGTPAGGKALLVSDEKQGKETGPLYKARLEMLGFTVSELGGDCSGTPNGKFDVIVISESCESGPIAKGGVMDRIATPVVSAEGNWVDESGLGNFGPKVANQTTIQIIDPTHPIAAGLSGKVVVYPQPHGHHFGTSPAPGVTKVATQDGNPDNFALLAAEKGAQLTQGRLAPARRVHWFWESEAGANLTADGWKIFDACVKWAAGRI